MSLTKPAASTFNYPYWFIVGLMTIGILVVAGMTVKQTQDRHQTFAKLSQLEKDYRKMYTEEQRLLIEQQTFSSTPVVAKRAATDLKMFYPDDRHRRVIAPPKFGYRLGGHKLDNTKTPQKSNK